MCGELALAEDMACRKRDYGMNGCAFTEGHFVKCVCTFHIVIVLVVPDHLRIESISTFISDSCSAVLLICCPAFSDVNKTVCDVRIPDGRKLPHKDNFLPREMGTISGTQYCNFIQIP
jgi:hypothetical protein